MRFAPAFILLTLASSAVADAPNLFDIQVSTDGFSWSDAVLTNPGESVFVRAIFAATRPAGTFGGLELTQIDIANSDAGETATSFTGRFVPNTQTFALLGAGSPGARIDRTDAAGNLIFGNASGSNGGSKDNPIQLCIFRYNTAGLGGRSILLDVPAANFVSGFNWQGNTPVPYSAADITFDGAVINFVPAPGALIPLAGAGLVVRRRR